MTTDTDRCPADEDTDRGGHLPIPPPVTVLSPEAQSDLLVRLVCGVEEIGRDVRLLLEEGRVHARRLTALEERIARLRCQCGDGCPPEQAAE